ncbi:DUF58 domain-containing protein [Methylocystis heyeri]|uniref:DUF58 domain-containing protein n=1 Tax=Methylocystis heyeri TaxID=391905 RepID=A0A6B8KC82_9HYPH|nr:DUF58 domain-containing protein [Methylocystis heyeri]QGM46024.1 DUF58 domain-containing protein [Methylocystis heyeri]
MTPPEELRYRPRGCFRSNHVGSHPSTEVGGFGVFRDQAPFLKYPDARRIDLKASLRDPYGQIYVRRFERRQSIDVVAIVDLSASMGCGRACDKVALSCKIVEALAYSATKIGDRFCLIGCDEGMRGNMLLPPTRSRSLALGVGSRLRQEAFDGRSAKGFLKAAQALGVTRKLVCLISDFRWPHDVVLRVIDAFSAHDAIPIVVLDSSEETPPPWGLMELIDSESGDRRVLAMRPGLRRRWIERERERKFRLSRIAADRCRPPVFVRDVFDSGAISLQLMAA